jgi:hypothetical protein
MSPVEYFLKASVHAQMIFKILACPLQEKN